jgi:hypothetical protein
VKLRLIIDGYPHEIDSTDPELLARWIVEIFGRMPTIYASTQIEVQAAPSFVLAIADPPSWRPDWIADSRVIGQRLPVRSPRELVASLARQLDELDALKEREAGSGQAQDA